MVRNTEREPDTAWLIWSYEHNAWWRPNSAGYTSDPRNAGVYDTKEAKGIVKQSLGQEVMLPKEAINKAIYQMLVNLSWDFQ